MGWPTAAVLIAVVVGFAVESMWRAYVKNRYSDEPKED